MKKLYKIVKSELFKEQMKYLPDDVKVELNKVLKKIAKNPTGASNTMAMFGKPTPEELKQWMGKVRGYTIDSVLEYLKDKGCLNKRGKDFAYAFWLRYIKK